MKLAEYLARKKHNVLLIFADMTTPPLPCICASTDLEGEKSLGSILAATHVTENLIKKNCMFYKKNDYLSMVGMLKGEDSVSDCKGLMDIEIKDDKFIVSITLKNEKRT